MWLTLFIKCTYAIYSYYSIISAMKICSHAATGFMEFMSIPWRPSFLRTTVYIYIYYHAKKNETKQKTDTCIGMLCYSASESIS